MIDFYSILSDFWTILREMAPYLLFGFLVAGILSVFITSEMVEKNLGKKGIRSIIKAAIWGIPLPLCSCGVIPVASSLYRHGASRSATTSFLISTPQTGVDSMLITYSMLGPIFTIFRPISAFIAGIIGGIISELINPQSTQQINKPSIVATESPDENIIKRILRYGFISLPQDIGKPLLLGLVIAVLISMLIPADFFAGSIGNNFSGMLVMMLVGIPIYVCATASVPIAVALIYAGISPGAALVFLMTGPATNAATISTIWKLLGKKSAVIYLTTVAGCALLSGYLLDLVSGNHINIIQHAGHQMISPIFQDICGVLLLLILLNAIWKLYNQPEFTGEENMTNDDQSKLILNVSGMTCNHCIENVKNALMECEQVENVDVNLAKGTVQIKGTNLQNQILETAIVSAGYSIN